MNEALRKKIVENGLRRAVNSMAKEKATEHDDIRVEFFSKIVAYLR